MYIIKQSKWNLLMFRQTHALSLMLKIVIEVVNVILFIMGCFGAVHGWWRWWYFYEKSYHNLNFTRILSQKPLFLGWLWFMFNNLGLALGANFKFYLSLEKGYKLKVERFAGQFLRLRKLQGKNWKEAFLPSHLWWWCEKSVYKNIFGKVYTPKYTDAERRR